jgi:hypothetical protein
MPRCRRNPSLVTRQLLNESSSAPAAKKSQSFLCPRPRHHVDARSAAQYLAHGIRNRAAVEVRVGFGGEVPVPLAARFSGHCSARITSGTSSSPPASSSSTLTSGFSARRRATTDPEEPDPQTMSRTAAVAQNQAVADCDERVRRSSPWLIASAGLVYMSSSHFDMLVELFCQLNRLRQCSIGVRRRL